MTHIAGLFSPASSPTAAHRSQSRRRIGLRVRWRAGRLGLTIYLAAYVRFALTGTEFMRRGKLSRRATNHVRGYDASAPSRALASFRSHVSKPSVNQL